MAKARWGPWWCFGHPYWMHYDCVGCRKCWLIARIRLLLGQTATWDSRGEMRRRGILASGPRCGWCGEPAPYGDERWVWMRWHDSLLHRAFWFWRRPRWAD